MQNNPQASTLSSFPASQRVDVCDAAVGERVFHETCGLEINTHTKTSD